MTVKPVFTIEGTITVEHHVAERALVGTWHSLSTPHFREALTKAMEEAGRLGAVSWVIDLTHNPGVPSQDDLEWIAGTAVRLAKRNGVRALINVQGQSSIAKLGSKRWSKSANEGGMSTYDCVTMEDGLKLAADVASGKAT